MENKKSNCTRGGIDFVVGQNHYSNLIIRVFYFELVDYKSRVTS